KPKRILLLTESVDRTVGPAAATRPGHRVPGADHPCGKGISDCPFIDVTRAILTGIMNRYGRKYHIFHKNRQVWTTRSWGFSFGGVLLISMWRPPTSAS